MKKKFQKIILLFLLIVTLTGCTKRFTIEDKEDNTKKAYVSNIICKPESEDLLKIYTDNAKEQKIDIDNLPNCSELKINSGGYEGLWTSIFVKPLAWLIIKLGNLVKNYGISIMIIGFLLRALMFPISKKTNNMSKNMKKAQKDLENLERKYRGREDKEAMMMKSQEMLMIYKKYDISPFSGCLVALIQTPIFFAFLEAVYRVPAFFEETLWKFNLGATPLEGFKAGNYWYAILIILIGLATYYSFKNIQTPTSEEQQKQTKMMSTIMLVFIIIASFSLPTAIALYWIVSNGFTVLQNLILKERKN